MNKILLVIIVLIVALGAFTLLGNKNSNQTPTQSSESMSSQKQTENTTEKTVETQSGNQLVAVALTDSDFTPKDITVKVGTVVTWTNKSGVKATVSSDDHPTHRLYPFLNLGEFADGSSVQVVFDTAGKYSYHDHYNATSTGTVMVE